MHPNAVDGAVIVLIGLAVADGLRRGFGAYATELIAFGMGLAPALLVYQPVAGFLHRWLFAPEALAGFGVFLAVLVVGHGIVLTLIRSVVEPAMRRFFVWVSPRQRKSLGAAPAFLAGIGIATLVLTILQVMPPPAPISNLIRDSALGSRLVSSAAFVQPALRQLLAPSPATNVAASNNCDLANSGVDAFCSLALPNNLKVEPDHAAEERMLTLLNNQRLHLGLTPLQLDPTLQNVARGHSKDMYLRKYFSHHTPDGLDYNARLNAAGITGVAAGENIAYAPNVDDAEQILLNSPEHLRNIVDPDFRKVGIGVYQAAGYSEMFTQEFTT